MSLINRIRQRAAQIISPSPAVAPWSGSGDDEATQIDTFGMFCAAIDALKPQRVLEVGTAQSVQGRSTHHFRLFPHVERADYVMADIAAGPDVDVVADLHQLPSEWTGRFDAFVAMAVFEHLARPWIAAQEVERVLAPGGVCYVSTHQTFPLHGYPKDFFRFSTEALALIFADAGLEVVAVCYQHRTKILLPPHLLQPEHLDSWNQQFPSYTLVNLMAKKPTSA